jgi:hypothetical protein
MLTLAQSPPNGALVLLAHVCTTTRQSSRGVTVVARVRTRDPA